MGYHQGPWVNQNNQASNNNQYQRFANNTQKYTNVNLNKRQYNETLHKIAGFSFPNNNLLLVALMKRLSNSSEKNDKETYISFVTSVLGVGVGSNRTYDFNQKIVQKFSLRDLKALSFAIKRLAENDLSILPYAKFTNSGEGSKNLYLQFHSKGQSNNKPDSIVIGSTWNQLKINLIFSKPDAHGVADCIDQLYNIGIKLELQEQMNRNYSNSDLNNNQKSNIIPTNSNNIPLPTLTNLPDQGMNINSNFNQQPINRNNNSQQLSSSPENQFPTNNLINAQNSTSVLANFEQMVLS